MNYLHDYFGLIGKGELIALFALAVVLVVADRVILFADDHPFPGLITLYKRFRNK